MPRRNRVTPFGEIVSVADRGTLMGNRGILHDEAGAIRRDWQSRRWIFCVLEFKGRHREVMTPDRYTELFFLDEATGLAAGHRPCAECQRARYVQYRDAWAAGNRVGGSGVFVRADTIDHRLHAERVGPSRGKRTGRVALDHLPDGVFATLDHSVELPLLVLGERLLTWSPGGYNGRRLRPRGVEVNLLTPRSTLAAIRAGFVPRVHPSAKN